MVFGVFDGLHPGHLFFLRQAKKYGRELVVVVARDSAVFKLKKKWPHYEERRRLQEIKRIKAIKRAVLGDRTQGVYRVVRKFKPDVICFGYDQRDFEKDLKRRMRQNFFHPFRVVRLKSHHPKIFHSSRLRAKITPER